MRYQIRLTFKANEDIAEVLEWFESQNTTRAAAKWFAGLDEKLSSLKTNPDRCQKSVEFDGSDPPIYEMHFGKRN